MKKVPIWKQTFQEIKRNIIEAASKEGDENPSKMAHDMAVDTDVAEIRNIAKKRYGGDLKKAYDEWLKTTSLGPEGQAEVKDHLGVFEEYEQIDEALNHNDAELKAAGYKMTKKYPRLGQTGPHSVWVHDKNGHRIEREHYYGKIRYWSSNDDAQGSSILKHTAKDAIAHGKSVMESVQYHPTDSNKTISVYVSRIRTHAKEKYNGDVMKAFNLWQMNTLAGNNEIEAVKKALISSVNEEIDHTGTYPRKVKYTGPSDGRIKTGDHVTAIQKPKVGGSVTVHNGTHQFQVHRKDLDHVNEEVKIEEGFETPNQVKMYVDHFSNIEFHDYPVPHYVEFLSDYWKRKTEEAMGVSDPVEEPEAE